MCTRVYTHSVLELDSLVRQFVKEVTHTHTSHTHTDSALGNV